MRVQDKESKSLGSLCPKWRLYIQQQEVHRSHRRVFMGLLHFYVPLSRQPWAPRSWQTALHEKHQAGFCRFEWCREWKGEGRERERGGRGRQKTGETPGCQLTPSWRYKEQKCRSFQQKTLSFHVEGLDTKREPWKHTRTDAGGL